MIPLRDINPTRTTPVVTYTLIAVNTLIFVYQWHLGPQAAQALVERYGMIPYLITGVGHWTSYLTPLSSMFMHGGWLHLIFNMWSLHIFGDNVEDDMGSLRFTVFYVACGVAAAAAQTAIDPDSMVPMVGASGAIAGVLAAYMRLYPRARVLTAIPVFLFVILRELPAAIFIAFWFLIQLLSGVGSLATLGGEHGGVAFFAHIGGFVAGLWLLGVFRGTQRRRGPRRRYTVR